MRVYFFCHYDLPKRMHIIASLVTKQVYDITNRVWCHMIFYIIMTSSKQHQIVICKQHGCKVPIIYNIYGGFTGQ